MALSSEIWVVIISVLGSIIVAVITANARTNVMLADIKVKLEIVYEIYVKDALRDARKRELLVENSPLLTTDRWTELMTKPLLKKITESATLFTVQNRGKFDPTKFELFVIKKFGQELYHTSIESDVPMKAIWAALQVFIRDVITPLFEGKNGTSSISS